MQAHMHNAPINVFPHPPPSGYVGAYRGFDIFSVNGSYIGQSSLSNPYLLPGDPHPSIGDLTNIIYIKKQNYFINFDI